MRSEFLRVRWQASASAGSAGQGAFLAFHCNRPASKSMAPANAKTGVLCSLIHTNCGTVLTKLDRAAPAPMATSRAGNAQQIKVEVLVNRETIFTRRLLPATSTG